MTNDQYGTYQTPSSRPPEPPYRADSQNYYQGGQVLYQQNQASQPMQTSVNAQGASQGFTPSNEPDLSGIDRSAEIHGAAPQRSVGSSTYTQPMGTARGGDTASMPYGSVGTPQYRSYEAQPAHGAARAATRQSGAGKTFLFGFLGAFLACALAFAGFFAWSNFNRTTTTAAATTTIGAADSSVINAVEEGKTLAEAVAAKALPSVVAVYNYQKASPGYGYGYGFGYTSNSAADSDELDAAGMGSGVVISKDGYILTNYHVVEGADAITVKVGDDERDATVVGGDESSDVAVIKVENTDGLEPADIGDSDDLAIGEWVMTVGAPLGLEQSVATGIVSATNRSNIMSNNDSGDMYSMYYGSQNPTYTYYPNMIQTDAVINPGNSGGALVDSDGKLIGINTMISSYSGDYAGVGFAIPVNYAIAIANDIIAGKQPTHAMLGVSISSVNASNAQRYGLSASTGAYVASIAEGTGAAESDLQVGDIITQVEDTKITTSTDVTLEVREHNPGDTVTVTVNRNGETLQIPVVLSSDENVSSASNDQNGQGQDMGQGQGRGNGYGYGGGSGGYSMEELEELLRMLGM